jgi:hypothetical protein
VIELVAFTSGRLLVWTKDFADIMKDEALIRGLRFHGGGYSRWNISNDLKWFLENGN